MTLPKIPRSWLVAALGAIGFIALYFIFQILYAFEQVVAGEIPSFDLAHIFSVNPETHLMSALLRVAILLAALLLSRHAFQAAQRSQEHLKRILETASDGIYFVNRSGRMTMVNAAVERMLGATREEICQTTYNHPSWKTTTLDGKPFPDEEQPFSRVIKTGAPVHGVEQCLQRTDGKQILVSINATPLRSEFGQVIGVVGTLTDITERKRTEELQTQLAAIVESSQDAIYSKTLDGTITNWNKSAEIIYGYRADEVIGKSVAVIVPPEKLSELDLLMERLRRGERIEHYETQRVRKDGTRMDVDLTVSLLTDENGALVGASVIGRDITDRKRTEEQLKLMSRATEQSSASVVITDPSGAIQYVNSMFTMVTGYTLEESIGKNPRILKSGQTPPEEYKRLWDAITLGRAWNGEFVNKKKNGELYWESAAISPIMDAAGKITHYLAVKEDITERKRAADQLRVSEERYRNIVENANDIIYQTDANGRFIFYNATASRLLKYSADELIGRHYLDIINPSSRKETRRFYLEQIIRHVPSTYHEVAVIGKDGTIYWVGQNVQLLTEQGRVVGFQSVARDITERKRMEEQLAYQAYLLDHVDDAVIATDKNFAITSWNHASERIYGWKQAEVLGMTASKVLQPKFVDQPSVQVRQQLAQGSEYFGEVEQSRKDGTRISVEGHSTALRDSSGAVAGFITVNRDITERKHAEEELRESEERYRLLMETLPDGVVVHSQGRVVFANPASATIIGAASPADLIGKPVMGFVHPDSQAMALKRIQHALAEGVRLPSTEEKFVRLDGTPIDTEVSAIPFSYANQPAMLTVFNDVTERKLAEESLKHREAELRESQRIARIGSWEWSIATGVIGWSDGMNHLLARDVNMPEPTFETLPQFYTPESWQRLGAAIGKSIETGASYVLELEMICADGASCWTTTNGEAIRGADGTVVQLRGTVHDITERKQADLEIHRRVEQLATLNEIGRSVSTVRELTSVFETIYEQVGRIIPFDSFYISLYDSETDNLWFPFLFDGGKRYESERIKPLPGSDSFKTLTTGIPRRIIRTPEELAQPIRLATGVGDQSRQSAALLFAPLFVKDKVIGVVSAQSYTPNAYSEDHLQLLTSIAYQAAIAIDSARLFEALHKSEDRYKELYDQAPIAYYTVDADDGRIRMANARMAEMLGYTVAELISRPIFDFYADTPAGKVKARQVFEHLRAGEETRTEEMQMQTSAGTSLWVSISVEPVRNGEGQVIHSLSMALDITERKRAEEEIGHRNQELAALNQIGQALNHRVVPTEILELIYTQVNSLLDNRNFYIALFDEVNQQISFPVYTINGERRSPSARSPRNGITEYILRTKEPLWIPSEMNGKLEEIGIDLIGQPACCFLGVPLLVGGKAIGVIAVQDYEKENAYAERAVDLLVTFAAQAAIALDNARLLDAVRESEIKYRNIFENAVVGIYQSSIEGKWLTVNSALARMLGYESLVQLIDEMSDLNHQFYVDPNRRAEFLKQMEADEMVLRFESEVYCRDGSVIWISENARTVHDTTGKLVGFEGTAIDITDRKQVDQLKSEFVSIVSHELRTPLTSIRGSLGLIAGGVAGEVAPKAKSLIDIAYKNSERLVLLINDILDVEKIESGKMTFDNQPFELMPLLEQAAEANTGFAEQFGVKIGIKNTLPGVMLNADSGRVTQVVTNLLSNAVKFSPRGSAVELTVMRRKANVRVSVIDHGPGIPENFQSRIFQKFAQADSSATRQVGGTGLGLNISKAIVEKLGGRIGFETQPKVGTTFFFDLPEWRDPSKPEVPGRTRLLICEDDGDTASLLQLLLDQAGYASDIALDAAQAKTMLKKNHYAAMTLDLVLPGQDGISLLRELRGLNETHNLPVIVISVQAEQGRMALNGDAVEVIDWISKPINPERLLGAVRCAAAHLAKQPHILHIDDDEDVLQIVSLMLHNIAQVDRAPNLKEARRCLRQEHYDLAILDLDLPDGSGLEIVPLLQEQTPPVPIVVFSVEEISPETAGKVSAVLVKSRTSNEKLVQTIQSLVEARQPVTA